jgi:hypothetical protein
MSNCKLDTDHLDAALKSVSHLLMYIATVAERTPPGQNCIERSYIRHIESPRMIVLA